MCKSGRKGGYVPAQMQGKWGELHPHHANKGPETGYLGTAVEGIRVLGTLVLGASVLHMAGSRHGSHFQLRRLTHQNSAYR